MSTTGKLRALLDERGMEYQMSSGINKGAMEPYERYVIIGDDGFTKAIIETSANAKAALITLRCTPEQAVAATLGRPKAKAHPYGYEPDTGAYDATRCECGCINDISATFCNDCGGEIEIDESAEKEIYKQCRNTVFATKHDDGTLEFGEKLYIAATLGSGTCQNVAKQPDDVAFWPIPHFTCSECGKAYAMTDYAYFCPNCGKKVQQ
ncbi:MAG: hypothetical protein IJ111_01420 [Eggerthellaceae bacterium]|nr:hypothetical protein [Eggerthellaceae bacterium]